MYAPYVAEMVRQEMIERFGGDVLTKGYHVTTTIDPVLQAAADSAVRDGLRVYDHRHGWREPEQHLDLAADADASRDRRACCARSRPRAACCPRWCCRTRRRHADRGAAPTAASSTLAGGAMPLDRQAAGGAGQARRPGARAPVARAARTEPAGRTARWQLDQMPRAQAALVSLDADNGALRALVGGYSFAGNKFNRATQARRQPGSSFKPFLYAAAFERGFNPASIVLDAPVVFKDRRGHDWRPQNDSGNFAGPMRLREALVQSRNLVSVRLLDAIGVDYARTLHQPLRLRRSQPAAQPVDVAGHRLADADVDRPRLRGVRQRRLPGHPVVHRQRARPRRQGDLQGEAGRSPARPARSPP